MRYPGDNSSLLDDLCCCCKCSNTRTRCLRGSIGAAGIGDSGVPDTPSINGATITAATAVSRRRSIQRIGH